MQSFVHACSFFELHKQACKLGSLRCTLDELRCKVAKPFCNGPRHLARAEELTCAFALMRIDEDTLLGGDARLLCTLA